MTTETPTNSPQADGGASPRTEAGSAGTETLDALLNEFGKAKDGTTPAAVLKAVAPVIDYVNAEKAEKAHLKVANAVKEAVAFVKKADEAKDVPDDLVQGILEVRAGKDPSFKQAFERQFQDPQTWAAKLNEARSDAAKLLKGWGGEREDGSRIASDVAAAKAAVSGDVPRNAGEAAPIDPVKAFRMPEQEWQRLKEELIAQAER